MNPLSEYREKDEEAKPIARIGSFGLVKYQKKEEKIVVGIDMPGLMSQEFIFGMKCAAPLIPQDLFGNPIVKKERKRYVKKGDGERKTVLKEIKDIMDLEAKQQKKPPVNTKLFAIRLSHIPTKDLYFMLSEGRSYRHRTGKPFSKYIMGSVKPRKE